MNIENQYLAMVHRILTEGELKENRTGTDTLVIPTVMLQHDMSKGFPLLTTKKMYTKGIFVELEGFIKGITSKKWYKDRGCNIWNEWCNPQALIGLGDNDDVKEAQLAEDDLGAIYGYQWRRFNQPYKGVNSEALTSHINPYDQLRNIIDTLKSNPNDRRMLCFAWNPLQKYQQALPACHLGFNVQHINGKLHLTWFQRSCDVFIGVPYNIASYALLLELICAHTGMEAGTLSGVLCDTHIYVNHIDQMKVQISRDTFQLPTIELPTDLDIFQWTHEEVEVYDYKSHGRLKGVVAV